MINRVQNSNYIKLSMLKIRITYILLLFLIGYCSNNTKKVKKEAIKNTHKENTLIDNKILKDTITLKDTLINLKGEKGNNKNSKIDTFPYFADYKGIRYYFPCGPCRDRFIRGPQKYIDRKKKVGAKINQRKL